MFLKRRVKKTSCFHYPACRVYGSGCQLWLYAPAAVLYSASGCIERLEATKLKKTIWMAEKGKQVGSELPESRAGVELEADGGATTERMEQMRRNAKGLNQLAQLTHSPVDGVRNILAIPPLKIAYARHSGKVGGLQLERAYFFKTLCSHFFPNESSSEWWFPNVFLPRQCIPRLRRRNLLRMYYRSKMSSQALSDYTFVLFMRDPCSRAVSSYLWGLPSFGRTAQSRSTLTLDQFVHNPELIERRGRKHPRWHWQTQIQGILQSNLPRIDVVGCVHTLNSDINALIEELNRRPGVYNGTLAALPKVGSSSSSSDDPAGAPINAARNNTAKEELLWKMQNTSLCSEGVCNGFFSLDCKLSPCWER